MISIVKKKNKIKRELLSKIVEQGKHYELMNNHGKYYELANV